MHDAIALIGAEAPSGRAIARRLRAEQYSCMLMRSDVSAAQVKAMDPAGIVVAGELPEGAASPDAALLTLGIPLLALGSAARALLTAIARERAESATASQVLSIAYEPVPIFAKMDSTERWIERADHFVLDAPYRVIADGNGVPVAFGDEAAGIYLLQFQIERNDPDGTRILRSFAGSVCGCTPWWTTENIISAAQARIARAVGDGDAICAMSGGLDSSVAAVLTRQAIGDRARFVFVDTGLLREGEAEETERCIREELGLGIERIDVSGRILHALEGVRTMEGKWRVVEREITDVLRTSASGEHAYPVYIKGTNYVDVLEGEHAAPEANAIRVVEPLRELFKDEIRSLGEALHLPAVMLRRQPFPGMGLAARICGAVTAQRLHVLRRADAIFVEEIVRAGQDKRTERFFAMLDETNGFLEIILRALQGAEPTMSAARLPHDLLERCVERIRKELPSVDRVLLDVTPGMAEWPFVSSAGRKGFA